MINSAYFPRSAKATPLAEAVVKAFRAGHASYTSDNHTFTSNETLAHVAPHLEALGFRVESGKKKIEKISVPVLYGNNGVVDKSFDADAYHEKEKFVIEVEAGRGLVNNQFLKDLFQACMMDDVEYLSIALRNVYVAGGTKSQDFVQVVRWFDTLYASSRLQLPLKGILIIGY
jgi:hypothetical protein